MGVKEGKRAEEEEEEEEEEEGNTIFTCMAFMLGGYLCAMQRTIQDPQSPP